MAHRRLYQCGLLLIFILGCSEHRAPSPLLPFPQEQCESSMVGKKMRWDDTHFWEFASGDKLSVEVKDVWAYPTYCVVECQVETTKDGKKFLIGRVRQEWRKKGLDWVLDEVKPIQGISIKEQI